MVERAKMNRPPPAQAERTYSQTLAAENAKVDEMIRNGVAAEMRPRRSAEPTIAELEALLRIDTFDLTSADAEQPELFYRVAKRLGMLNAERDAAKLALEQAEARATISIRDEIPEGQKVTVGEIEAAVKLHDRVIEAKERVASLTRQIAEVAALKEAYSQRKSSLTDLVELQRQAGQPVDPARVKSEVAEQRRAGGAYQFGRRTHGQ